MPSTLIPFTADGTYTPPAWVTSVDVLVVGGGGAGGCSNADASGGGGGAGGLVFQTVAVTPGVPVTIVVGAGGAAGAAGASTPGGDGAGSAFGAVSVLGGGGGGAGGGTETGRAGGSGSGGGGHDGAGTNPAGGAGTAGQGTNGGNGSGANFGNNNGGGGGGASVAGAGRQGGAGTNLAPTFGTTYGVAGVFAGGGTGGIHNGTALGGGAGGGGNGAASFGGAQATAGAANSGGGGGGGQANTAAGKNGGSGVVLVLEPVAAVDGTYDNEVLADTPSIYLRLGENSGAALDSSGNTRPGAFAGNEILRNQDGLIAGDSNGSVLFLATGAGASGVLDVPYGSWMDTMTAFDVLVRPRTATGRVLSRDDGTLRVFQFGIVAQKATLTWWNEPTGGPTTITGATTLGLNKAAHIGATLDGSGVWRLHVNGVVDATSAAGQSLKVAAVGMRVGAQNDATATVKFDGRIDEVAAYATAPSTARMVAHWVAAGSPATLTDAQLSAMTTEVGVVLNPDLRFSNLVTQVAMIVGQHVDTSGQGTLSATGKSVVAGDVDASGEGTLTAEGHRISIGPQLVPDPGQLMDLLWLRVPDHYREADRALDWPMFRYIAGVLQVFSEPYTLLNRIDYLGFTLPDEET